MQQLIQNALNRRVDLMESSETDSFRLLDGIGDGFPDVYLDQIGEHWLLSTKDGVLEEEIVSALSTFQKTVYWKKLDQHEKESPTLLCGEPVPELFMGKENGLCYELSFHSGYSQGIFLDQRENRARLLEMVKPGERILNTFAYTGAFSVAAASVGGVTTTLDLSQPYLDWARRNMTHNGIAHEDQYFCKGDTFHWLNRFAKSGKTFHGIILDPPTFSRDSKGKVFRVEKHYHRLVKLAASVLAPDGWILACTNCRKLTSTQFQNQLEKGAPELTQLDYLPMPDEYSGENYLKSYLMRRE